MKKVLFCLHIIQLGYRWLKGYSNLFMVKYEALSAGASPTHVNPFAVKVMAEIGVDISKQRSKSIEEFGNKDIDLIVSVCDNSAKVVCPFCLSTQIGGRPKIIEETLPGAISYLHNAFSDPLEVEGSDEEKLAAFRCISDDIKKWILDYFAKMY